MTGITFSLKSDYLKNKTFSSKNIWLTHAKQDEYTNSMDLNHTTSAQSC